MLPSSRLGLQPRASFASYLALLTAAALVVADAELGTWAAAAAALAFLLLGVRNSWDAITYHVSVSGRGSNSDTIP
jgi:hypothetical protein